MCESPAETDLYYLQSRYYDPEVGRFINADDAFFGPNNDVVSYNLYVYAINNPTALGDYNGQFPIALSVTTGALLELLFDVAASVVFINLVQKIGTAVSHAINNQGTPSVKDKKLEFDNDLPYARNSINRPSKNKIKIEMEHILSGHSAGGNRGGPNKDRFPGWMSPVMIERAVREAYINADKAGPLQFSIQNGKEVFRQFFRGRWSGGVIEFWFNYTTRTIETAWPK